MFNRQASKKTKKNTAINVKVSHRARNITLITIGSVILLALISVFIGTQLIDSKLDNVNYVSDSTSGASSGSDKTTGGEKLESDKGVYNVLLIGSDNRDPDSNGRSDSMILVSMNNNTKKVTMVSFMRDMYVSIPGHGKNRINAAYAFGGANLLIQTIEDNFIIKIDNYACVDFYSFIKVIDAVGGVTIDVTKDELPVLNDYVKEINSLEHLPSNSGLLSSAGNNLLLTGKQALGYSRIRYIGNNDFQRTQRQRTVLNAVIKKIKKQNLLQINNALDVLLPNITTNIPKKKLNSLCMGALTYLNYDMAQDRIPIDGSFGYEKIDGMDVLSVNFDKNQKELESVLYGK